MTCCEQTGISYLTNGAIHTLDASTLKIDKVLLKSVERFTLDLDEILLHYILVS